MCRVTCRAMPMRARKEPNDCDLVWVAAVQNGEDSRNVEGWKKKTKTKIRKWANKGEETISASRRKESLIEFMNHKQPIMEYTVHFPLKSQATAATRSYLCWLTCYDLDYLYDDWLAFFRLLTSVLREMIMLTLTLL